MLLHMLSDGGAEADVVEFVTFGTESRRISLRKPSRRLVAPRLLPGILLIFSFIVRLLRRFLLRRKGTADLRGSTLLLFGPRLLLRRAILRPRRRLPSVLQELFDFVEQRLLTADRPTLRSASAVRTTRHLRRLLLIVRAEDLIQDADADHDGPDDDLDPIARSGERQPC